MVSAAVYTTVKLFYSTSIEFEVSSSAGGGSVEHGVSLPLSTVSLSNVERRGCHIVPTRTCLSVIAMGIAMIGDVVQDECERRISMAR